MADQLYAMAQSLQEVQETLRWLVQHIKKIESDVDEISRRLHSVDDTVEKIYRNMD